MMDRWQIWPIIENNGPPDEILAAVWAQMCRENRAAEVFYGGTVYDEDSWLEFIHSSQNHACLLIDAEAPAVRCVAWLNGLSDGYAFGHFCVLGTPYNRAIGKKIADYWRGFTDEAGRPLFRMILGLTPALNTQALRMIRTIGFKHTGTIPRLCRMVYHNRYDDGVISVLDFGR